MTHAAKCGSVLFIQPVPVCMTNSTILPQCLHLWTCREFFTWEWTCKEHSTFKDDGQKQLLSHEEQWAEAETSLCGGSINVSDKGTWFTRFIKHGNPYATLPRTWKNPHFLPKNPTARRTSGKERHWLSNVHRYKHASIYIVVALKFEKAQIRLLSLTGGWKS